MIGFCGKLFIAQNSLKGTGLGSFRQWHRAMGSPHKPDQFPYPEIIYFKRKYYKKLIDKTF
jgi:hypothetical protein